MELSLYVILLLCHDLAVHCFHDKHFRTPVNRFCNERRLNVLISTTSISLSLVSKREEYQKVFLLSTAFEGFNILSATS